MSSAEYIILRFVAMLDIISRAVVPWLMGLIAVIVSVSVGLLVYRFVRKLNIM